MSKDLSNSTEHELNDLPANKPESSQNQAEVRLLDDRFYQEGADETGSSRKSSTLKPFIKRTWTQLAHGHTRPTVGPSQRDSVLHAWQGGLRGATILASCIMILNLILLFASLHFSSNGVVTLFHGSCSRVAVIDSGLHVLINVLSTVFLAATNYVMQVLNAPSRRQLDRYHARGRSLDIGIPSVKNVFLLGPKRFILWFLLGLSAIPLHLFWNSTVFQTLQANDYMIFLVSSDFNTTNFSCNDNQYCDLAETAYNLAKEPGALEYLETSECMTTYGVNFLTGRRNLVLIGNTTQLQYPNGTTALNGSLFRVLDSRYWLEYLADVDDNPSWNPNYWWCGSSSSSSDPAWVTDSWNDIVDLQIHSPPDGASFANMPVCSISEAIAHAADLQYVTNASASITAPWGIEYGLSEPVPEDCQLGFAVYIMVIVVACNIIKVGSMIASFWVLDDNPIVLIGDALSSFLEDEDEITIGHCLMETRETLADHDPSGTPWKARQRFWFYAPSPFSILRCLIFCTASLGAAGYCLWLGIQDLAYTNKTFSDSTFSGVNPSTMIQNLMPANLDPASFRALAFAVLIANSPQLVYSTLYFMYNRLLTSMLAMDEWTRFQYHAATLRVSYPDRGQRSTYWLHLPYTYGIPLLVLSTVMHWLISQSLFLTRIQMYDAYGNAIPQSVWLDSDATGIVTDVGYSPKAMAATIGVGSSMVLGLVVLSLRRYRKGIPLIGNNSLAISAACHPPEEDHDPAHSKLMWGAIDHGDETRPGRCSLTSIPVMAPIQGRKYA